MRAKEKYPNTETFTYYNANPKNRIGADCTVRAVCTALEQSWDQTVREMTETGLKHGYLLNDKTCIEKYLKEMGWVKHKQPRKADGTKYTGKEFCRLIQNGEKIDGSSMDRIVANIGGLHMAAIIDGTVHDIWDSTDKCIGNWWTKG